MGDRFVKEPGCFLLRFPSLSEWARVAGIRLRSALAKRIAFNSDAFLELVHVHLTALL